jgi:hypothetical protein
LENEDKDGHISTQIPILKRLRRDPEPRVTYNEENGKKIFNCPSCLEPWPQLKIASHIKGIKMCDFCDKSFCGRKAKDTFTRHIKNKSCMNKYAGYICACCGMKFKSNSKKTLHEKACLKKQNKEKLSTCKHCGKFYPFQSYLERHLKGCRDQHEKKLADSLININININNEATSLEANPSTIILPANITSEQKKLIDFYINKSNRATSHGVASHSNTSHRVISHGVASHGVASQEPTLVRRVILPDTITSEQINEYITILHKTTQKQPFIAENTPQIVNNDVEFMRKLDDDGASAIVKTEEIMIKTEMTFENEQLFDPLA